jgi:2-polyprenyl-3-methyl-5-hydroxy-6-metoxy-1,4-benzoquinol methylase
MMTLAHGTTASDRWRNALADWAIPPEILAAAPESPWGFPVELFSRRADDAARTPEALTPSNRRALDALPDGGTVLDVGCGAGAASVPLTSRAARLIGVDSSTEMLDAFAAKTAAAGAQAETIQGRWPEAANLAPMADVVVCHHVAYNAPDLSEFVRRLTNHAHGRVVMELTLEHPQSRLNPLWLHFHGVVRPRHPHASDAADVIREAGFAPMTETWNQHRGGGFGRKEDLVAWVRRQLCLPAERDPEVAQLLEPRLQVRGGLYDFRDRPIMTIWWDKMSP